MKTIKYIEFSNQDPIKVFHDEYINKVWPTRILALFITFLFLYSTVETIFQIIDLINNKPKSNISNIYVKIKTGLKKFLIYFLSSLPIVTILVFLVNSNYVKNATTLILIYLVMSIFSMVINSIIRDIIIKPFPNYSNYSIYNPYIINNPIRMK